MFKFILISSLCILSVSVGNAVDNNLFIQSYTPDPSPVEPVYTQPAATASSGQDDSSQFTNFHGYDYWEVGKETVHDTNTAPPATSAAPDQTDSEIVTAQVENPPVPEPAVRPELVFPENPPRPEPRPVRPADKSPTKPAETTTVFDIPNCRYRQNCWKGKGLSQKIQKIVSNVETINRLHGAKLDPRYLLCTGYRESTFNPGAVGSQNEKGMFQVMPDTGAGALRYGPKVLPKANYMTQMAKSTLAQTELSFLTLKMKVAEGASARTLNGNGTIEDYKNLARRYNGDGPAAYRYAAAVSKCHSCMRSSFPNISGAVNESKALTCLNKAKH